MESFNLAGVEYVCVSEESCKVDTKKEEREKKKCEEPPITTLTMAVVAFKGHLCTLGQVIKPITQYNPLLICNFHLES